MPSRTNPVLARCGLPSRISARTRAAAVLCLLIVAPPTLADAAGVAAVYPSGASLPERTLRLSIAFAAAPADITTPEIDLRRADDGRPIKDAFLKQPLWSPDRRVLTLLLDPGRVKSGLMARDAAGAPLAPGQTVALFLAGAPIKTWIVAPGGCAVPDPSRWRIAPPGAGGRDTLVVTQSGQLDMHSRELIAIADDAGRRVPGTARLTRGETVWSFAPDQPWTAGPHQLIIHPALESPCGDRPGARFERRAGNGAPVPTPLSVEFTVD